MNLLSRKVRGFRLVDLVGFSLLVMIILGVYLAKTVAGRERAEIARIERQIAREAARVRLLRAEVAHLEQPRRISALSTTFLGLAPASIRREISTEELAAVAAKAAPVVILSPTPTPVTAPAATSIEAPDPDPVLDPDLDPVAPPSQDQSPVADGTAQ